jgi:hypothetical protein
MNERIQELAEQADNYAKETVHYYNGVFHALTWKQKFKQVRDTKFAELIEAHFAADVTEAVTKCIIEVEKLLCEKIGRKWSPSRMCIESLVDELCSKNAADERRRCAGVGSRLNDNRR